VEPQDPRGQQRQQQRSALPNEPYYTGLAQQRRPPDRRRLATALIIVGLIWLLSNLAPNLPILGHGLGGGSALFDERVDARRLALDAGSADVTLVRGDVRQIQIQAFRDGGSDEDFTVSLVVDGETARVSHTSAPCFLLCDRSLSYVVTMPADAQVSVQSSSGDVTAEGLSGGVDLRTLSGDISLTDVSGPLAVTTTSGDIEVGAGDVASANITTTSGSVEIEGEASALVVQTVSGDIEITNTRSATVSLATTSGDIEYGGSLSAEGDHTVSTISGDVDLRLPEDAALAVEASSVSGSLTTDFPVSGTMADRTMSGTIGAGGARLVITTTSGDIAIEQQ
jgi:Putative adhesin